MASRDPRRAPPGPRAEVTAITEERERSLYATSNTPFVKGGTVVQEQLERVSTTPPSGLSSLFGSHSPSDTAKKVAEYFESSGFTRWTAIYGQGGIPPIWKIIRDGHDRAVDTVIEWIREDQRTTALDAGCGTGNLAVRLADCGFIVDAFDVSAPMVSFAKYITKDRTRGVDPNFHVGDIAALDAKEQMYDLVCCLDVLFHYPHDEVTGMLSKLLSVSKHKVIGSFAIKTPSNSFWMSVGSKYFHQKNRMTTLHLLSKDQVEQILHRNGFKMVRTKRVKKFFYDSYVFEATRQ